MKRWGFALALAGSLCLLAGCGTGKKDPAVADTAPPLQQDASAGDLPFVWPPKLQEAFPDLELVDQTGARTKLSSFKGKAILLEPIGMNCPGCQAFAGAAKYGSFQGIAPQRGLPSIEQGLADYGGATLDDERIVFVQLLLYSMEMKAPTADDAKAWAEHFKMDRAKNQVVLAGEANMIGPASYGMIPGFYLIDKDFILRADSTGHKPHDNLWEMLIPLSKKLVEEVK